MLVKSVRAMNVLSAAVLVRALPGKLPLAAAEVTGVGRMAFSVADLDRSVSFFTDVLSFRWVSRNQTVSGEFDRLTTRVEHGGDRISGRLLPRSR